MEALRFAAPGTGRPAIALSPRGRWAATAAATALSTYALDLVATAAGVVLVVSGTLEGLGRPLVLLFLAASYVVWGAGLAANLRANWALLERTGTSTNLPSKALHDLVGLRTGSVRARKAAAAVGYVGTEVAKETPYYLGAFGAVLLSDAVSADEALVFLAGANLGAAAYEYGLAGLTRAVLGPGAAPGYASFETDWSPRGYLADYYRELEADERSTIAFFVDAIRAAPRGEPVLLLGVGPTLHHVFLAAPAASEIHLADYLPANLREIERWIRRDPEAHDWRPFVRFTLQCEGVPAPTAGEVDAREELTRARITRLLEVDLRRAEPLGDRGHRRYGTVVSAYCADSATADRGIWRSYMRRIVDLVRPDGTFLTAALRRSRGYRVSGRTFPSADVDEADLREALAPRFAPGQLTIEVRELAEAAPKGYSGIVLARAGGRLDARG